MDSSNQKKQDQLGMPQGTAANKLRKSLLFRYIQQAGDDNCFQCGEKINSVDDLSIEHKVPYLDSNNPVELFFSLDNIAFSHLRCNVRAARKFQPKGELHGNSKVTNEEVREIRQKREDGWKLMDIANYYNISRQCVQHIVSGEYWSHV